VNSKNTTAIEKSTLFGLGLGASYSFKGTEKLDPYIGGDFVFGIGMGSSDQKDDFLDSNNNNTGNGTQTVIKDQNLMQFGVRPIVGFNYFFRENLLSVQNLDIIS